MLSPKELEIVFHFVRFAAKKHLPVGLKFDEEQCLLKASAGKLATLSYGTYLGLATYITSHAAHRVYFHAPLGQGQELRFDLWVLYLTIFAFLFPVYLAQLTFAVWRRELAMLFNILVHQNQNQSFGNSGKGIMRETFLGYAIVGLDRKSVV